jgi:hypothetical protein
MLLVRDESSIGGFFSWDFNKYVGLDSSASFFPRNMDLLTIQQGGRMVQAVGGLRAGVRRGRIGVFVKARPGIQLFTETFQSIPADGIGTISPFTNIALDIGGILEFYPAHHMVIRLDGGETLVFYRPRTIPTFPDSSQSLPGFSESAMQVSLGVGFRFGFPHTNATVH